MRTSTHILRLREYETAAIGAEWDVAKKIVPPYVVAELARFQAEQCAEYVAISRYQIKTQNFVGVVGVGDRAIEILPKIDEADDGARQRLLQMISIAGLLPCLEAGIADLAPSVPCLLDVFMQAYIRQLAVEWRRGRISDYHKTDENRACLRGKLLFHEQIHRNRLRPERFFTRADQFITDVLASRLLKAGLNVCRRYGIADATRRGATTLLAEFDGVSNHSFTDSEMGAIEPDRRIARFAPLLTLAKRFIRGCVPDRPGGAATYSLLFDMNDVFELYIGRLLRRACPAPYRVQLQATGRSLAIRDGKQKFLLRPDVAVRHGREFVILIDTKWKLLDASKPHEGVRQSDMYQAYAYAREFDCPRVILLYPQHGGIGPNIANYRLSPGDDNCPRIEVTTVDVTQPPSRVWQQLGQMVQAALHGPVTTG
jgi:5-methylcytosine-specific restriction enzyme subunit McrC